MCSFANAKLQAKAEKTFTIIEQKLLLFCYYIRFKKAINSSAGSGTEK